MWSFPLCTRTTIRMQKAIYEDQCLKRLNWSKKSWDVCQCISLVLYADKDKGSFFMNDMNLVYVHRYVYKCDHFLCVRGLQYECRKPSTRISVWRDWTEVKNPGMFASVYHWCYTLTKIRGHFLWMTWIWYMFISMCVYVIMSHVYAPLNTFPPRRKPSTKSLNWSTISCDVFQRILLSAVYVDKHQGSFSRMLCIWDMFTRMCLYVNIW